MVRMRHPHPNVAGEIDAPESAVGSHRMSGWLTDDEWERAGLPEPEPPAADDEDGEPDETGEDTAGEDTKPRRSRRTAHAKED